MSYQVIARKWRPQTFEEVTGQEVITHTLRNALEYDRLHHAYLFSGARGVGKTTTARILAKALNCHKTDKPNLTPCLLNDPTACPSCIEISESRSMDVLEIDAASHTGIDDVRGTIIDGINFNPARDRYKVFIIDEVHQLSKSAFNALLKTLEEPPNNVVFIMATTELHKVPETILSRCQEFEFRTIPLQKIFDRLKLIADAENIDISDDALRELSRSGEGSMRDAQSNFDQVISFSSDKISAADVTNALGFAGVEILTKTINAISEKQPKAILAVVDDIIARGHDLRNFCRDLLGLFRDLLVFKVAADDKHLFEGAVFNEDEMRSMAASFTEADLLRFFNSLCETEASLREAAHPRYVLEIGLVKLIEMRSVTTIESILERLDSLSTGVPLKSEQGAIATGSSHSAAASANNTQEKKTLKPEPTDTGGNASINDRAKVQEVSAAHSFAEAALPDEVPDIDESPVEEPIIETSAIVEHYVPTVRLPSLSAAELEHIDDARLDDGYEDKLRLTGDDLLPIKSLNKIVETLLGIRPANAVNSTQHAAAAAPTATAAAPAFDVAKFRDEFVPKEESVELPILSSDPTEAELLEYANAHPVVRAAKRIFRAKIVEVRKA
ncbi:MAG: DNA polymerase III subunit gamma/tau [Chloracidobacterium sp.]|nr:DNA polymerase III subunit gamma/tau [Chloracidobacterium sp.]